jgi:RNA polymerase sigma-70 factor (ECF subfamily)
MPPYPMWYQGREAVVATLAASWDPGQPSYVGRFRTVAVRANGQPAIATYLREPGAPAYAATAIAVLQITDGLIVEIIAFHDPGLFPAFALPATLPPHDR